MNRFLKTALMAWLPIVSAAVVWGVVSFARWDADLSTAGTDVRDDGVLLDQHDHNWRDAVALAAA